MVQLNGLNLFSQIKGMVEQSLGHLFSLFPHVILISSIKPISSSIFSIVFRFKFIKKQ